MEKQISKLMETLEITREEALELLEFDKGNTDNEEADKLEDKDKKNKKEEKSNTGKKGNSLDKVKNQKAKKKVDETKDEIMQILENTLDGNTEVFKNSQSLTSSKITFMAKDGNYYSVSLTKHKAKPDGYSEEK